ncbi:MAG: aldo/keto reductase [Methanomassiliicoccales archaeon]|nr:aldo/keto reductase [Methanomassiliicoccales archaeon]
MEYRQLGKSDLKISAISLGAWQWGMGLYWGYKKMLRKDDIFLAKEKAVELGVNFIDTAEVYGWGASERVIGEIISRKDGMFIATKYFPFRLTSDAVFRAVEKSLRRLRTNTIDLYQIHFPNPLQSISRLMRNMELLIKRGKIRYIGVSNYGIQWLEKAREALSFSDIVSNQIHYSLIYRYPETNGLLDYCKKNRIGVIAYSPLEQGLLSGRYLTSGKITGLRRLKPSFSRRNIRRLEPLIAALEKAASAHSKSIAQGALNWVIRDKNIIAIPGARNAEQIESNCGAVGWSFTDEELFSIERAYQRYARLRG